MKNNIVLATLVNPPVMPMKQLSCNANSLIHSSDVTKNKSQTNNSKVALKSSLSDDSISKSVLFAKHLRFKNQENETQCLKNQMDILVNENKTLRTQIVRQEKELINIDNQDFNVKKLIEQHKFEILVLKEKLRKAKDNLAMEQNLRKESDSETLKLRSALYKSKEIIEEKGLIEKMELKKQLDDSINNVSTTKKLLEITQNKLNYLEGNYRIELTNCHKQSRSYSEKCEELESKINFLNVSLKEKEKQLEIQNIYSNRFNLSKLNKKFDDENIITCQSKSLNELNRSDKANGNNKTNSESKFQILSKGKIDQSELKRKKILEDIRKVIAEEINMGNFAIIYKPSQACLDKQCFPLKPLTVDKHIDSPFIIEDAPEIETPMTEIFEEPTNDSLKMLINPIHTNILQDNSNVSNHEDDDDESKTTEKPQSSMNSIINLKSKLKSRIKTTTDKTSPMEIEVQPKNESQLQFMYPIHDSIISEESWWDDLETISVLNSVCNVKNRSHDKVNIEDKIDLSKLSNNAEKSFTTLEFMRKLPKPIIDDLKDRELLIDKTYTNLFSESRIGRICIGNINQKKISLKLPVNQFEKSENFYQANTISSVI